MLCPQCGTEVGDLPQLCLACRQAKEVLEQQQLEQQELQSREKKPSLFSKRQRKSENVELTEAEVLNLEPEQGELQKQAQQIVNSFETDPLLLFFQFFSSPLGVAFVCVIFYLILFLTVVVFMPREGLVGGALIALVLTGFLIGSASPYLFPKFEDNGVSAIRGNSRRYLGIVVGYMVTGIGLGLYSWKSGDGPLKVYHRIRAEMDKSDFYGDDDSSY